MKRDAKILSIIVPAYNMERYLKTACESLFSNSDILRWIEVIIVNDGSTDKTSSLAHFYEEHYPEACIVVDKANGHYGSCVNRGLSLVTGKYVRILDADDYMQIDGFSSYVYKLHELLRQDPCGPDLVLTNYCSVDLHGNRLSTAVIDAPQNLHFDFAEAQTLIRGHIGHPSISYKVSLLRKIGYCQTEGSPYTDMEWYTLPMAFVQTAYYMPWVTMCILVGRDGQTMTPSIYARDFPKVMALTLGIVAKVKAWEKRGDLSEVHRQLMTIKLRDKLLDVYASSVLGINGLMPQGNLKSFDAQLKKISQELYEQILINQSICHVKISVVALWRDSRTTARVTLELFKLYMKAVRISLRLLRVFRKKSLFSKGCNSQQD